MAQTTISIPVQELIGDIDEANVYLLVPRDILAPTVAAGDHIFGTTQAAPVPGISYLWLGVTEGADKYVIPVEELLGDEDPNSLYLLTSKAVIGSAVAGDVLEAVVVPYEADGVARVALSILLT